MTSTLGRQPRGRSLTEKHAISPHMSKKMYKTAWLAAFAYTNSPSIMNTVDKHIIGLLFYRGYLLTTPSTDR